jgi:hypothetical protein
MIIASVIYVSKNPSPVALEIFLGFMVLVGIVWLFTGGKNK